VRYDYFVITLRGETSKERQRQARTYMKAQLIQIGNSRGIRIPKAILLQCEISGEVNLAVKGRQIILSPLPEKPRQGWREAAAEMAAAGDDALLIPDVFVDDIDSE
jgi:antitoxin MazE